MDYVFSVDVDVAHSFRLGKLVAPRATIELYDHEWDIGRLPEEDRYVLGRGIGDFGVIGEGIRSGTSYVNFYGKFKVKEATIQGLIGAIREKLDDSPDARDLPEAVPVDEEPAKTVDCLECHGTGEAPNPQFSCAYCKDEDGVSTGKIRQLAERELMPAIRTLEKVLANAKIDRSEIRNAIAMLRRAF